MWAYVVRKQDHDGYVAQYTRCGAAFDEVAQRGAGHYVERVPLESGVGRILESRDDCADD